MMKRYTNLTEKKAFAVKFTEKYKIAHAADAFEVYIFFLFR
jgi:hypothetical protein